MKNGVEIYINAEQESKVKELEKLKLLAENPKRKKNGITTLIMYQKFFSKIIFRVFLRRSQTTFNQLIYFRKRKDPLQLQRTI